MNINLIYARAANGVIGKNNKDNGVKATLTVGF